MVTLPNVIVAVSSTRYDRFFPKTASDIFDLAIRHDPAKGKNEHDGGYDNRARFGKISR
jgi:hypothetical protein